MIILRIIIISILHYFHSITEVSPSELLFARIVSKKQKQKESHDRHSKWKMPVSVLCVVYNHRSTWYYSKELAN